MLKRLTDIDRILKFDSSEVYCKIMWKTFAFFCFFIPLLQATPLELGAGKNQQIKRTITDCESTYVEPNECAGWVSDCQNSMYVTWMRANCKVTCGVCKGLPPPYLTPEKITFDVSECLAANNLNRSKHGAPNLQWDASLASGSANWALYLAQKSEVQLEHSVANGQYGENIYYSATSVVGTVASCKKAVESWYAEIKDYDFNNPGFSHSTGHFTQVVWKATTKVGVGVAAVTKNGFTYTFVVARYTPAGNMNMPGYFAANVLSPSK